MFDFLKKKKITQLSEQELRSIKENMEEEISRRRELCKGTAENIAKKINEILHLKENKNKLIVFTRGAYIQIIRVSGTTAKGYADSTISLHNSKGGITWGNWPNTWERLDSYSNQEYISLDKISDTTLDLVISCLKTEEETITIINNHLDTCCNDFKKNYLDIAKNRLSLK